MAPTLMETSTLILNEATIADIGQSHFQKSDKRPVLQTQVPKSTKREQNKQYQWEIVWRNALFFIYLHYGVIYGFYLLIVHASYLTTLFGVLLALVGGHGITMGAHRLWAHKSYKANLPLRILLCICQTIAFQNHIYEWVRDHRVHHKFTDSDADPHNSRRGFFFSHMGWLIIKKHNDVKTKGATIDMSDLEQDGVVMFQKKFYLVLMPICTFILPTLIPWYYWNENLITSWYLCLFRYSWSLHSTWLVNSAAHIYGMKPYDKNISPTETKFVSVLAIGEGWHNYHHVFPWDYKAGEFGFNKYNITAGTIDFFAKLGWAWDLKTVSQDMMEKRAKRTGDGTRTTEDEQSEDDNDGDNHHHHHHPDDMLWGWGDKDMQTDEVENVRKYNKLKDD